MDLHIPDEHWLALAREAASAAEHIAFGVTILERASFAEAAHYMQAFFALSTGFERAAKLAIVANDPEATERERQAAVTFRDGALAVGSILLALRALAWISEE